VNRLQDYDFGAAVLDLRSASVGPLQIDQASIVMPPGVVLSTIQYDHVDLRFEPIITREVSIVPIVVGSPAADYPLVRVEAEPARWPIRGGRSEVEGVEQLSTEPLDISGANNTLTRTLALIPPNGHVTLERAEGEPPRVEVRAVIEPVVETRQWVIPVDVPEQLDHSGVIPSTYTVEVTGPRPKFRRLGELQLEVAVEAEVVPLREKTTTGGRMVEVRFGWGDDVPEDVRQALRLHHRVVRVSLPPDSPRSPGRGDRNTGQPP
jgi:hypothetical protein